MRIDRLSFVVPALALALGACADEATVDSEPDGPATAVALLEGKADTATATATASELRVRVGQLTIWFDIRTIVDTAGPTGQRVVITGRASRNLESVFSWVPDDAFGEAAITAPRSFEIVLDEAHEINTVLSGAPLFLSIVSKTGTPREYYARVVVEPRFYRFSGSSQMWIADAVPPVYVRNGRDDIAYRGSVTTTSAPSAFDVYTDDGNDPVVRIADPTTFEFDWEYAGLLGAMTPATDPVRFAATIDGAAANKTARLGPTVIDLAATTEDPYGTLITERTCDPAVYACIVEHNGADDLGACGSFRDVAICLAQGPVCGDDSADLELFPVDAPELDASVEAFNAACPNGFTWCSITSLAAFRLPECLEATPDVAGLVTLLMNMDPYGGGQAGWDGVVATRADVLATTFLSGAGTAGAQLLGTLDGWAGSTNAELWYAINEVPCHNCHEWQTFLVIFYPDTGRLFAILGTNGWDS